MNHTKPLFYPLSNLKDGENLVQLDSDKNFVKFEG